MNVLPSEKRAQILNCLIEGCSMRSTQRLTGSAKKTVERLLVSIGKSCASAHDKLVRKLRSDSIQLDEIWSFVGCKETHLKAEQKGRGRGDCWTWTAIDSNTKLIVAYHIGFREHSDASAFLDDVAARIEGRVQITTDGFTAYKAAIENAFGTRADYGISVKIYGRPEEKSRVDARYSPLRCKEVKNTPVSGNPDLAKISTSFVERQNLTMRMGNRRFTRLTNAFSKNVENHEHSIALHFMHYNFCRIHQTLRCTPAMAAGLTDRVWELSDLVDLS